MKTIESVYELEKELLYAVSRGQTEKAEELLSSFMKIPLPKRVDDPLRNMKNYSIILNTLLRKAAEQGDVHPYHIDNLSSSFAMQIENLLSMDAGHQLHRNMVRKYSLLVKNHSMHGYSLPVRKALALIDTDLTSDLSLKYLSRALSISPSYLSKLFRKETGATLTDYVNKKKMEHAIFLLNTTSMQIQAIAQDCGILDVNYFTKLFKKYYSQTPKEYRQAMLKK